jgi:hypothetical protein
MQYAKASDGVNIAYWTMGSGKPLVHLPMGVSCHIASEPGIPGGALV